MTAVGGKRRLLSGGTGFLAISGVVLLALAFTHHFSVAIVLSSTIAIAVCGSERFLLTGVGFLFLVIFVVDLGHGVCVIILVRHCCYVKSQGGYSLCLFSLTVTSRFGMLAYWGLCESWHPSVYVMTHDVTSAVPISAWEITNDLNHQIIDSVGVSWLPCSGLTNFPHGYDPTRIRSHTDMIPHGYDPTRIWSHTDMIPHGCGLWRFIGYQLDYRQSQRWLGR